MEKELTKVMRLMIGKLVRMDKWGGAHTEMRNLTKGLPLHFTQSRKGKKIIAEVMKELNKREFIITKQSTGELHVSLNSKQLKEIMRFYEERIPK